MSGHPRFADAEAAVLQWRVAHQIRAALHRRQMSLARFATLTGISRGTLHRYLTVHQDMPLNWVVRAFMALGLTFDLWLEPDLGQGEFWATLAALSECPVCGEG